MSLSKTTRSLLTCWMLCLLVLHTGCVRRRLLVRSNPPGAMVYVDNQPIGNTPCATSFTYYGTREIRLVKAGYETLTVNQPIPAPWYQLPPCDFVSENLVPREIQDYRTVSFNLQPQVIVPSEQLLGRAEQLRQSALPGAVLPANATGTAGATSASQPILGPVLAPGTTTPPTANPETLAPGFADPNSDTLPPTGQALERRQ